MPCSIRGSAMVALDLDIDTATVSPVRKRRQLGALFWSAIAWIGLIAAAATLADFLPLPAPSDMDMLDRRAPPSFEHLLGTDALGRDMLARLVYGARVSLTVGFLAPLIGLIIGGTLGML